MVSRKNYLSFTILRTLQITFPVKVSIVKDNNSAVSCEFVCTVSSFIKKNPGGNLIICTFIHLHTT